MGDRINFWQHLSTADSLFHKRDTAASYILQSMLLIDFFEGMPWESASCFLKQELFHEVWIVSLIYLFI